MNPFKSIIDYFSGMRRLQLENNELVCLARREGAENRKADRAWQESLNSYINAHLQGLAGLEKRISSIELEMILMRGGKVQEKKDESSE